MEKSWALLEPRAKAGLPLSPNQCVKGVAHRGPTDGSRAGTARDCRMQGGTLTTQRPTPTLPQMGFLTRGGLLR